MENENKAAWKPSDMEIIEALQTLSEDELKYFIERLRSLVKQTVTEEQL